MKEVAKYLQPRNRNILQRMSNMSRYNNMIRLHTENVAEHSFYVSVYAMAICDKLNITGPSLMMIIMKALIHDIHETEISDIPHNVKKMIPGLEEKAIEFELKYNEEHFPNIVEAINGCSDEDQELIDTIVTMADVISVIQYAQTEITLGNKEFTDVKISAMNRINDCCSIIEKHGYCTNDLRHWTC